MSSLIDKGLFATWLSIAVKIIPVAAILPYLLINYEKPISNFWLILISFTSFGLVFEFGLTSTFERFIAYLRSGKNISENSKGLTLNEIIFTSKRLFFLLSAIVFFGFLVLGSLFILTPMNLAIEASIYLTLPNMVCLWIYVIFCTSIGLFNFFYSSIFRGFNKIYEYRIRESIAYGFILLLALSALLILNDFIIFAYIYFSSPLIVLLLLRNKFNNLKIYTQPKTHDKNLLQTIWGSAWRSGLGVLISSAMINFSGIVVAQFLNPSSTSAFLVSLRILQSFIAICNPIYYVKIPRLAYLYKSTGPSSVLSEASARKLVTLFLYLLLIYSITTLLPYINKFINEPIVILDKLSWCILCIGFLFERLSGLYIQTFSLSNIIVWHRVNLATFLSFIFISSLLFPAYSSLGICLAFFISYFLVNYFLSIYYYLKHYEITFSKNDIVLFFMPFSALGILII